MKGRLDIGRKLLKLEGLAQGFFQNWGNGSSFEGCRDSSSGERGVNDSRNEEDQEGKAGFNKLCGEGIKLTSRWLGFPDEFCNF